MTTAFKQAFYTSAYGQKFSHYFNDIAQCWAVILVASAVAFVLGYLYLFVIRLIGGWIIWICYDLILAALFAGGFYSYFYARTKYDPQDPVNRYLAYAAYVLWALCGLQLLALICCYNAVKVGIAVFKTTAQYVQANMSVFFLPGISTILASLWFIFWLSSAIFIFSVGTPYPNTNYPFITDVKWNQTTRSIFVYHMFALFWVNSFIIGCV